MRQRYCKVCDGWHDVSEPWPEECNPRASSRVVHVMADIQPYKSMIDGSMIGSRSVHRDHLRAHGCIEVGNEKMESKPPAPKTTRREWLYRQLWDMSDRQANKILKELRRS